MVLGKLPVPGRRTIRITGQGPTSLAVGAGGVVWTFLLSSILSLPPLSPSLWETARYRLNYCLKGPIPNFRRQPGNRSRLKCVYGFIMELVSFSSIILKLIMIL